MDYNGWYNRKDSVVAGCCIFMGGCSVIEAFCHGFLQYLTAAQPCQLCRLGFTSSLQSPLLDVRSWKCKKSLSTSQHVVLARHMISEMVLRIFSTGSPLRAMLRDPHHQMHLWILHFPRTLSMSPPWAPLVVAAQRFLDAWRGGVVGRLWWAPE